MKLNIQLKQRLVYCNPQKLLEDMWYDQVECIYLNLFFLNERFTCVFDCGLMVSLLYLLFNLLDKYKSKSKFGDIHQSPHKHTCRCTQTLNIFRICRFGGKSGLMLLISAWNLKR